MGLENAVCMPSIDHRSFSDAISINFTAPHACLAIQERLFKFADNFQRSEQQKALV